MELREAIQRFRRHLSSERNLAPRTVEAYRYELERFRGHLIDILKSEPDCHKLDSYCLKNYLAVLKEEHEARPATLARVVSSLRGFFRWLWEEGVIEADPASGLRHPKKGRKLPIFLTGSEAQDLSAHVEEKCPEAQRNRTMLLLLVMTGIRLSELVGIDVEDVDFERDTIKVLGKGRKERLVPMNRACRVAIERWLEDRPAGREGCRALFLDKHGNRITPRMVQYAVRKAVKALGLDPRISPHKLRHTFATSLYAEEVDLRDIQELLGHANIVSTSIYTHTNVDKVRTAVEKLRMSRRDGYGTPPPEDLR